MRFIPVASVALAIVSAPLLRGAEVQRHGFVWETWIADTFFGGHRQASYTQAWDIPAAANRDRGGTPANPKIAKLGTPVDLGDALRQFDIDEPFLLLIGYWLQEGDAKRIVNVVAVRVEPETWRALWGGITRADLEGLDAVIKDRATGHVEARRRAQAIKSRPPFTDAVITVNPKIDARGQRRLQCSLGFDAVFAHLAPNMSRTPADTVLLWGVPVPGPFYSPPRSLGPDPD